jgi:hypothetical protein
MDVNRADNAAWRMFRLPHSPADAMRRLGFDRLVEFRMGRAVDVSRDMDERYGLIFLDGDHRLKTVVAEIHSAPAGRSTCCRWAIFPGRPSSAPREPVSPCSAGLREGGCDEECQMNGADERRRSRRLLSGDTTLYFPSGSDASIQQHTSAFSAFIG